MRDDEGEQGSTEVEIVFAGERSAESPLGQQAALPICSGSQIGLDGTYGTGRASC